MPNDERSVRVTPDMLPFCQVLSPDARYWCERKEGHAGDHGLLNAPERSSFTWARREGEGTVKQAYGPDIPHYPEL